MTDRSSEEAAPMRVAYADPPYLGCCRLYEHHHPDGLCWDDLTTHKLLIEPPHDTPPRPDPRVHRHRPLAGLPRVGHLRRLQRRPLSPLARTPVDPSPSSIQRSRLTSKENHPMAEATIKQISDFFKTGDPERDKLSSFSVEWKALSDADKQEVKELVAAAIA